LKKLKTSIKRDRQIGTLFSAMLTGIIMKMLSILYSNVPVAILPFQPVSYLSNIVSYNLDNAVTDDGSLVSAPFLFVICYMGCKIITRKFFTEQVRLGSIGQDNMDLAVPRSMLLSKNMKVNRPLEYFFGAFVSTYYSLYTVYKALKRYQSIKYMVSLSRVVSRMTGYMCSLELPVWMRYVMYGSFANAYGINMKEVEVEDFGHYKTFTEFFTRKLKKGARTVHEPTNAKSMCSPCDGRVLTCGPINTEFSTIDCVKGRSYRLDEFMLGKQGNDEDVNDITDIPNNSGVKKMLESVKERGNQMQYMVIYLSPADYHRFHSPAVHTAEYRRHVVGYLAPVKPDYVNKHKDVFKNNERVNIFGRWAQGFYFESAVGATNVGSIKLDFDTEVLTNQAVP